MDEEERTLLLDVEKARDEAEDCEQPLTGRPRQNWFRRFIRLLQNDSLLPDPEQCTIFSRDLPSPTTVLTYAVVPSFFRSSSTSESKARGTEWLDGLRGLAAWWVMNSHLASLLVKWSAAGYGSDDGSGNTYNTFWMLPFVRLSFAGQFSVYIFFVISGYALSLSPVRRMDKVNDNAAATLRAFSSSALRRPVRLFAPAIVSTFLGFVFVRLGLIEWAFAIFQHSSVLDGWDSRWTQFPSGSDMSLWAQSVDLWKENLKLLDIVKPTQSVPAYNPVLWTIVIEYRASLMLYLMHLAFFHLRRGYRVLLATLVLVASVRLGYLYELLFIFGYIMAELKGTADPVECKARWKTVLWAAAAILALWLASMPGFMPQYAPFYSTLGSMNPLGIDEAGHAWHRLAAMLLFVALSQETLLQWPFQTRVGAYLGKISFSLYLVHLPFVTVLGTYFFDKCMSAENSTEVPTIMLYFAAYTAMILPVFYVADRFQELVDQPSIDLSRHLERKMQKKTE